MEPMQQSPMLNRPPAQRRGPMRAPGQPAVGQQPANQPSLQQQPMAPQQAPTFAQMQAQGQARPAPPMPAPPGGSYGGGQGYAPGGSSYGPPHGYQPPTQPYAGQVNQSIMSALQTPSAYGTPQVQASFNQLGQQIDDQYTQRERATDEQFAKRGLYDSTANAGAMHDLNVGRKSAQETLAATLADKQAQDYASARQGAIGQAQAGQAQGANTALGYGNLNLAQQGQVQQGQLANRGMDINAQQGNDSHTVQLLQLMAALGINPSGG